MSTHLYEIGEDLKKYPNISFRYFETSVTDEQLEFSYQLKEGISNDRLGYLILKKEGVVELDGAKGVRIRIPLRAAAIREDAGDILQEALSRLKTQGAR